MTAQDKSPLPDHPDPETIDILVAALTEALQAVTPEHSALLHTPAKHLSLWLSLHFAMQRHGLHSLSWRMLMAENRLRRLVRRLTR